MKLECTKMWDKLRNGNVKKQYNVIKQNKKKREDKITNGKVQNQKQEKRRFDKEW